MASSSPVRVVIFARKRPDLTDEQFHTYWRTTHAEGFLALPLVKKHLLKYEQFHDPESILAQAEAVFKIAPSGFPGCSVHTYDSIEGMKATFSDPAYFAFVKEDGPKFSDGTGPTRFILPGAPEVRYQREGYSG